MLPHPFTETLTAKIASIGMALFAVSLQWILLVVYGNMPGALALADSLLSVGILSAAGYVAWFTLKFIRVWQAQVLLAFFVQIVSLGGSFMILLLLKMSELDILVNTFLLQFFFGLLMWTILQQWYWLVFKTEQMEQELVEKVMEQESVREAIDRISVKDGSRIHIVHLEELYCIQASGDYAILCTDGGQYVKEQTMKFFETNLPLTFVRIHRSSIVNTEYIQRVELFGKETYQVRLKNGQTLRASNTGYKLLKERLSL